MSGIQDPEKRIVIVGGGIIGCCSAYYLSRHPSFDPARHIITLIESSTIAGGSSGKAGGLVAKWAFPQQLSRVSFRLHNELAEEHDGAAKWGYRPVTCGEVAANGQSLQDLASGRLTAAKRTKSGTPRDLDWLDPGSVTDYDEVGDDKITAQVHPYQFTTAIAELAKQAGVEIRLNTEVVGLLSDNDNGRVKAVQYRDRSLPLADDRGFHGEIQATEVIVCAGPWTDKLYAPAPISTYRVHSITIRPTKPLSPYTVFTTIKLPSTFSSRTDEAHRTSTSTHKPGVAGGRKSKSVVTPEIYARPNNEVYVSGESDELAALPELTSLVQVDDARCEDIYDYVSSISAPLREGELMVKQACYLPLVDSRSGEGPLLGPTRTRNLFLAAGHSCWGISNAPATGKAISELIFDGKATCADITSFDPRVLCRPESA